MTGLVTVKFDAGGATSVSINPGVPVQIGERVLEAKHGEPEGKRKKRKKEKKGNNDHGREKIERWRVFWTLDETSVNPAYMVKFGNIVRLDRRAISDDHFVSRLDSDKPQAWVWEFDYHKGEPTKEVAYDIYLVYGLREELEKEESQEEGHTNRGRDVRFVSVRQLISVDPTLLIPPPP